MKYLLERYQALSLREKQWAMGGSIFLLIFIFYAGIFRPGLASVAALREQVVNMQKTVNEMESADRILTQMQRATHAKIAFTNTIALMGELKNKINQAGLGDYLTEMKQGENSALVLNFQKIEFDRLIAFLIDSGERYSFQVNKLSVTAAHTAGYVDVEMVVAL